MKKQNLLLLEDVIALGRSGEIVSVRCGYARNFLIPQKKAVVAGKHTLHLQERLKEERAKRIVEDRKEAEELAKRLEGVVLSKEVKVDPEGKMYGSVSSADIADLLKEKGFIIDKRQIDLKHPIKEVGIKEIPIRLKEGINAQIQIKIFAEKVATPEEKS